MQDAIFVAAPPGTVWPLTLGEFETRILVRYPEALCTAKHEPIRGQDYLAFEIDLDGERRHGSYFDRSHLILQDAPPAFWADTVVWFLGLLPPGTPAVAMIETNPDTAPIPPGAGAEDVRLLLEALQEAA
ncbi:hypothetical protein [Streptomyces canus]|uniref:Uncharacterized protein n=1 Tax=Streptomyces canus TaxID=58343 RepID=A0AAW8FMK2_9ACTN|nr:hypothetical protein [Streptomyces canus]MDQ0761001.1 hypothetical protein [Streptomyces canus]MDQ0910360.1 hypothetical protein [Streptomyces canus]MDQ1070373.1 hypothetical protein [Streptomyces canus]